MHVYCSPCQATFVGASRCPRCGSALIAPEDAPVADPLAEERPVPPGRPSLGNRFVVGTLIGLGLYLGFRRMVGGAVLAAAPDSMGWWESVPALTAVFGLQAMAVFAGGMLAGAARCKGFLTGLLVGGVCGSLFLAAEVFDGTPPQQLTLYIQPILLAVIGGIAAGVGGRVWPAVPEVATPVPAAKTLSSVRLLMATDVEEKERPTLWVRVIAASMIMAAGVLLADEARTFIQKGTAGMFKVESVGQGRFVSWQLATLAVLVGGMAAAAGTGAGLRHGLFAAFIASAVVVGTISAGAKDLPSPISYTLELLSVPPDPFAVAAVAVGSSLILVGIAGGWLGGQLFLPLAPAHMRQRLRTID